MKSYSEQRFYSILVFGQVQGRPNRVLSLKTILRNAPLKKQSVKIKSNGRTTSVECQSQNTENTWISSTESLDVKSPPSEMKPRKLSSHSQKLSLKGTHKHFNFNRLVSLWELLKFFGTRPFIYAEQQHAKMAVQSIRKFEIFRSFKRFKGVYWSTNEVIS